MRLRYPVVTTTDALQEVVDHYSPQGAFAIDVETAGDHRLDPRRNRITWVSLACQGRADVIPMGHPNGEYLRTERALLKSAQGRLDKGLPLREADYSKAAANATKVFGPPPQQLEPNEVFSALKPLLLNPDVYKVGHNIAFDAQSIAKYLGQIPAGPYIDTMIGSFLVDSRNKNHLGLDDCLLRELDVTMVKGIGKDVDQYTFDEVAQYAYLDVKWDWLLGLAICRGVIDGKAAEAFRTDMDVLAVTCDMENTGALIDTEALKTLKVKLDHDIEAAKGRVYKSAGKAFNLNSNPEKQRLLFEPTDVGGRGLVGKILTPKGKEKRRNGSPITPADMAVSAEALELFPGDPLAAALIEYGDLNKLMSTYVVPYLGGDVTRTTNGKERVEHRESLMREGRIHTQFLLHGADTGRFTSRNPNLQNVPNPRTSNGKAIRNLFVSGQGERLIVADYSQIEPRVAADFTQEPVMLNAYAKGLDIYTAIAEPFGVDRAGGKVLMLSMMYGVGPDTVAAQLGVTQRRAKTLLEDFSAEMSQVMRYKHTICRDARARKPTPYVTTLLGRRRYLPDLLSTSAGYRSRAERQVFNSLIQGSAADIIKMAMIRAHEMIPDGAKMILTVHDELVTSAPDHLAEETAEAIREAMEGVDAIRIPLVADVKIVDKWGEAK